MSNLDKISNFTYQEKIQLKIKCGKIMENFFWIYVSKKFKENDNHIEIKGRKILDNIYKEKQAIFIWSFRKFWVDVYGTIKAKISLATIYRPLNNIFLNPLMEKLRKKYICPNQIEKGLSGVKKSIEYQIKIIVLQWWLIKGFLGDKINFSITAFTTTLPAQLAIKYQIDIVPIYIQRNATTIS